MALEKLFLYFDDEIKKKNNNYIGYVHSGISNKLELLEVLSVELRFPDYFGSNWDALSDCLRDFYWIDEYSIFLVHKDLPLLPLHELRTYIEILSDSIKSWSESEDHKFYVVFNSSEEKNINEIMSS